MRISLKHLLLIASFCVLFFIFSVLVKKEESEGLSVPHVKPHDIPITDPFVIVGTKTNPPFLVAVYPTTIDAYISKTILTKGVHGDYLIFQNIFQRILGVGKLPYEPIFLDLGANIGFHSFQAASHGFQALLFEPNPKNINRIRLSTQMNEFEDRIRLFPYAVSDKAGTATLKISHNSPGMAMLGDKDQLLGDLQDHDLEIGGSDFQFDVEVVRLDDLIKHSILFLKIDVEGFEYHALRGAKKLLQDYGIGIIEMEVFPAMLRAAGTDTVELLDYIGSSGYTAYTLKGEKIKNFSAFEASIKQDEHTDVMFVNNRISSQVGPKLWM